MAERPSLDAWLREAREDPGAKDCGMFLFHNGVVRQSARAAVREGAADTPAVRGMRFSSDAEMSRPRGRGPSRCPASAMRACGSPRGS